MLTKNVSTISCFAAFKIVLFIKCKGGILQVYSIADNKIITSH